MTVTKSGVRQLWQLYRLSISVTPIASETLTDETKCAAEVC